MLHCNVYNSYVLLTMYRVIDALQWPSVSTHIVITILHQIRNV
jgi:hypothetical protein